MVQSLVQHTAVIRMSVAMINPRIVLYAGQQFGALI